MFCFMTSITYQEREKKSHPWKIKILIGFGRSLTVICQEELIFVQFHLSLLWFLHVLRLGRAAVSGQSDFLPPTVLSHHSVIVNKIWCFCCYSYSCSLWLGGHYKERHWETHTHQIKVLLNSKQESPIFLVNFIQYCSICVALFGFFHHSVLLSLQSRFSKTYIL